MHIKERINVCENRLDFETATWSRKKSISPMSMQWIHPYGRSTFAWPLLGRRDKLCDIPSGAQIGLEDITPSMPAVGSIQAHRMYPAFANERKKQFKEKNNHLVV